MSRRAAPKANSAVRSTEDAQYEPPGRSQGEFRSAQHGGCPMSRRAVPKVNTAVRSMQVA